MRISTAVIYLDIIACFFLTWEGRTVEAAILLAAASIIMGLRPPSTSSAKE